MEGDDKKPLLVQSEPSQNCDSFGPPSGMLGLTPRSLTKFYKSTLQSTVLGLNCRWKQPDITTTALIPMFSKGCGKREENSETSGGKTLPL